MWCLWWSFLLESRRRKATYVKLVSDNNPINDYRINLEVREVEKKHVWKHFWSHGCRRKQRQEQVQNSMQDALAWGCFRHRKTYEKRTVRASQNEFARCWQWIPMKWDSTKTHKICTISRFNAHITMFEVRNRHLELWPSLTVTVLQNKSCKMKFEAYCLP